LIEQRKTSLSEEPITFFDTRNVSDSELMGQRIRFRGELDFNHEMLVGYRAPPQGVVSRHAKGLSQNPQGFYVLTPVLDQDGKLIAVFNRGWVPKQAAYDDVDEKKRLKGEKVQDIIGVVSERESGSIFSPNHPRASDNNPILTEAEDRVVYYLWSDRKAMLRELRRFLPESAFPDREESILFVDKIVEDDEPKEHFPVAKRKNHFLEFYVDPVTHLSYALTWFSLAIAGAVISYHLLKRGRRLEMIKMRQMKKD
jgi:cytochrome oxidase assembly protein ShyY1